jgi:predicted  nucleic acid-binding Zn-ribbon protein
MAQLTQLKAATAALQQQVEQGKTGNTNLQTSIAAQQKALADLTAKLTANGDPAKQIQPLTDAITALNKQIATNQAIIQACTTMQAQQTQQLAALTPQEAQFKQHVALGKQKYDAVTKLLADATKHNTDVQTLAAVAAKVSRACETDCELAILWAGRGREGAVRRFDRADCDS